MPAATTASGADAEAVPAGHATGPATIAPTTSATTSAAGPPTSTVSRLFEVVLETSVLSFAAWTLLYCLGLATQWSLFPSGWLWLVLTVAIAGWRGWVLLRGPSDETRPPAAGAPDATHTADGTDTGPPTRSVVLGVAGVVLVTASALAGLAWRDGLFRLTWGSLVVGMALLVVAAYDAGRLPSRDVEDAERAAAEARAAAGRRRLVVPRRGGIERIVTLEDLAVVAVTALVAVAASLTHLADSDDPYYLNRSVWVAAHGNAAIKDTMFSPERLDSSYGGGLPIPSIEALLGVWAHMAGTLAGTAVYLVAAPLFAALAVLAMWRLVVRFAPRRRLLVLLGAVAFLMLSGDSMLGNFWIPRIWQGKVVAAVVVMPLIWSWLVDAHEGRTPRDRRWAILLLLASGVAFAGLTPTAEVWAPVMLGAILVAALVLRSRSLAVGGVAMAVGPVLAGLAVVLYPSEVGGEDPKALSAYKSFGRVLGDSQTPMIAVGLLALGLAVLLARRGVPAALAGASAFSGVIAFAPGLLPVINDVTGAGPILWRMLFVAPIPVLVGLLLAAPVPSVAAVPAVVRRPLVLLPALAVLAALAAGGLPVWSHTGHGGPVRLTDAPTWKLDLESLDDVRDLADGVPDLHGTVLLPKRRMEVLTMYTVDAFPVVPREFYVDNLPEPDQEEQARRLLLEVAQAPKTLPDQARVTAAMDLLDVDLACVGISAQRGPVLRLYAGAGFGDRHTYGSLACMSRDA